MSSKGYPLAYELHLFGRFCASQKVTEIGQNVFHVVHAISQGLEFPIGLQKPWLSTCPVVLKRMLYILHEFEYFHKGIFNVISLLLEQSFGA